MTTTLAPGATTRPAPGPLRARGARTRSGSLTASGVLLSEWIKLRSVRSTTLTLAAAAGVLLLVGALAAAVTGGFLASPDPDGGGPAGDPTGTALAGSLLTPLIIGVLGVLLVTGEYATGTIRATMTLVPRRLPVLAAKIAVLTAVTFPVMLAASLVTFWTGQALLAAGDTATAAIGDPGVLRAVIGTAAYHTAVALMGLAVGVLLRGTAAAVSVLFAVVFLLPGLGALLLPAGWQDDTLLYLPSNAASAFTSVAATPGLLDPAAGAAVLAAWVVVPLLLAAAALRRRAV